MRWVRRAAAVAVLLALVAAGLLVASAAREARRDGRALHGRVTAVVDGDTIRVRLASGRERPVRYIGIDTPEVPPGGSPECHGEAASEANRRLVAPGERVRLELDAEREDRYGRLLAYVRRASDDLLVNAALLRDGHARVLRVAPNTRNAERFERLEAEARAAGRGLWAACEGP